MFFDVLQSHGFKPIDNEWWHWYYEPQQTPQFETAESESTDFAQPTLMDDDITTQPLAQTGGFAGNESVETRPLTESERRQYLGQKDQFGFFKKPDKPEFF